MASLVPSLVIAFWTAVAFALGRGIAWATSRSRTARIAARVVVVLAALALAAFVLTSGMLRHALFIPLGLAAGCLTYGHDKLLPGLFR
jgi:hypothetical protein